MPPSIDPVKNMFSTGSGLVTRVLLCFVTIWLGTVLSYIAAAFQYWRDYLDLFDFFEPGYFSLEELLADLGYILLSVLGSPLIVIHYMGEVPLYGLFLMISLGICSFRIVFTDDPILFWCCLMITLLIPGQLFCDFAFPALVSFTLVSTGVISALWYAVNLDFPEWVDWFREKTGM